MTVWTDLTDVDFAVRRVQAGGVVTRALIAGEGPDVIFLHGTSGHLEAFSRNITAHAAAGWRCHAIDMLGHGYTGKPNEPYEIPRYVQHLIDYLDASGIEAAHLVGESLGGWVAAKMAIDAPARVESAQLIAAGGTKAVPAVMAKIKDSTTEAVINDDLELTRRRLELLLFNHERDVTDELVEIRHRIYHTDEFRRNLPNLLALQEMEVRQRNLLSPDDLGRIICPTLIVWGTDNPFGEVPEAEAMHAAIAGSILQIYPDCGHWPQYEHPDEYNRLSIEFLSSIGASKRLG